MPRRGSSKPPAEPVVKPHGCDFVLVNYIGFRDKGMLLIGGCTDPMEDRRLGKYGICRRHMHSGSRAIRGSSRLYVGRLPWQ